MYMVPKNATEVRKEWSSVLDSVVRDKPTLIKRTRDQLWFSNLEIMTDILDGYQFTAECIREEDSSITMVLNEIDLVENAPTEQEAKRKLAQSIVEYAVEFYDNYALYSHAPNRKKHIPYVFKALIVEDISELEGKIICHGGEN